VPINILDIIISNFSKAHRNWAICPSVCKTFG
jgi:hypothetical protein